MDDDGDGDFLIGAPGRDGAVVGDDTGRVYVVLDCGTADVDADGVLDCEDNCPADANAGLVDTDGDGLGDLCDLCPLDSDPGQPDVDSDRIPDACDNCAELPNSSQADADVDGVGDACDTNPVFIVSSDPSDNPDFASIQEAVNTATESGTPIEVLAGTGCYMGTILVDRSAVLRFVGVGGGVCVNGVGGPAFDVDSIFGQTPIVFRNLTLMGMAGIVAWWCEACGFLSFQHAPDRRLVQSGIAGNAGLSSGRIGGVSERPHRAGGPQCGSRAVVGGEAHFRPRAWACGITRWPVDQDQRRQLETRHQRNLGLGFQDAALAPVYRHTRMDCSDSAWSPDSKALAYSCKGRAENRVFLKGVDDSEDARVLFSTVPSAGTISPTSFSGDGSVLLMGRVTPDGFRVDALRLGENAEPVPLLADKSSRSASYSPDGRWIAYTSDESGFTQVYVRSIAPDLTLGSPRVVSPTRGEWPVWGPTRDGDLLVLFYQFGADLMEVRIATEPTLSVSEAQKVEGLDKLSVPENAVAPTADGRFLAVAVHEDDPRQSNLVFNFFEELRQRVPRD